MKIKFREATKHFMGKSQQQDMRKRQGLRCTASLLGGYA